MRAEHSQTFRGWSRRCRRRRAEIPLALRFAARLCRPRETRSPGACRLSLSTGRARHRGTGRKPLNSMRQTTASWLRRRPRESNFPIGNHGGDNCVIPSRVCTTQLPMPRLSQPAALFPDEIGGQCEGGKRGDNRCRRRDGESRGVPAGHIEEPAGEPRHEHAPHAPRREDLAVDGREARGAIEP